MAIPARLRNRPLQAIQARIKIRPIKCFQALRRVSETDSISILFLLALTTPSGVPDDNSQPVGMQRALDRNPPTFDQWRHSVAHRVLNQRLQQHAWHQGIPRFHGIAISILSRSPSLVCSIARYPSVKASS
jgi:hypothetical protein